jgi:hypothetical protein
VHTMATVIVATGTSSSSSTTVSWNLIALMAVGVLALGGYTAVYLSKGRASATFSRIFALIVVAILAVGLGFAGLTDATTTAGYTLLGTIAGYLAGTKTQTTVQPGTVTGTAGTGTTGGTGGTDTQTGVDDATASSSVQTYL